METNWCPQHNSHKGTVRDAFVNLLTVVCLRKIVWGSVPARRNGGREKRIINKGPSFQILSLCTVVSWHPVPNSCLSFLCAATSPCFGWCIQARIAELAQECGADGEITLSQFTAMVEKVKKVYYSKISIAPEQQKWGLEAWQSSICGICFCWF